MQRSLMSLVVPCVVICGFLFVVALCSASPVFYHDRASFTAVLGALQMYRQDDDYESYSLGSIPLGSRLGDFRYISDPNVTQPAIVPGFMGGKALGGSLYRFVGGDSVTLSYQPLFPQPGLPLLAFGADFSYLSSVSDIPADTYRLSIADGEAADQFGGNLTGMDPAGGTFFLGVIADPADAFTKVNLFSVQTDPSFQVPAYQVDNLIYATPEPTTIWRFVVGAVILLLVLMRRRKVPPSPSSQSSCGRAVGRAP